MQLFSSIPLFFVKKDFLLHFMGRSIRERQLSLRVVYGAKNDKVGVVK